MRPIAIVGSGIAGLLTAHGLRKAGHPVTLYSDRTPAQWLAESRPTGTAARFELALAYERELGLNHWEAEAPRGCGAHVTFCLKKGNRLVTLAGNLRDSYFLAIDVRLQSARWMHDLEARGGRIVIEQVTVERLDAIAAEHDLTLVAGGRGDLTKLFERDPSRSPHEKPPRQLAMVMTRGPRMGFDGVPYLPVKFNLFAPFGEAFWVPYFHKDVGPSWSLLIEAKEGGPFDRFRGVKTGPETLALFKEAIRDVVPWDYEWAKDMELSDPNGWLVASFTPMVRRPVGRLPSGRIVGAVGDAAMSLDPIAGQGANCGTKMARNLVDSIVAHGERPFDEAFLTETFESFFRGHGQATNDFTNLLLEPITAAGREILLAQYGSDGTGESGRQKIADGFIANFIDPQLLTSAFRDMKEARAFIEKCTGRSWVWSAIAGRLGVAKQQIRQAIGLPPTHPRACLTPLFERPR